MIIYKLIAIIFSLFLLVQSYVIRKKAGSYLVPGALFSFVWFLFTFVPLVLLFDVPINPLGVLFIVLSVFSFSMSAIPFNWHFALTKNKEKELFTLPNLNSKFLRYTLYVSFILSFIFSFNFVLSNGFDLQSFVTDFIGTSARYAALRGNDYLEYGVLGTLSVFFTYFSAVLGAIATYFKKSGVKKMMSFGFSIAPSLFAMLTQSSKLIFFVAIIFYLAATLLMKVLSNQRSLVNFSDSFKIILLSLLILPLLILAFVSREGYNDFNNSGEAMNLLLPAVNSYLFGSFYAFCDFFSYYLGMDSLAKYDVEYFNMGYYSFKAIYDALGGTKVFPPGFYIDNYAYKDVLATNIYSFFRGLVQDFGVLGSMVFMYVFGLFNHYFFYKLLVKMKPWLASGIFIMFFGFLGLSFLINIFTARYVFLIVIAFFVVLNINDFVYRNKMPK